MHPTSGIRRIFKQFSGFEFFLLSNIIHARPLAGNANRWAAPLYNRFLFKLVGVRFFSRIFGDARNAGRESVIKSCLSVARIPGA